MKNVEKITTERSWSEKLANRAGGAKAKPAFINRFILLFAIAASAGAVGACGGEELEDSDEATGPK